MALLGLEIQLVARLSCIHELLTILAKNTMVVLNNESFMTTKIVQFVDVALDVF